MNLIDLIILSISLAADATAASICKGMSLRQVKLKDSLIVGLYFGIFQALMPLIGYLLGYSFKSVITSIDHWIAFILLGVIGLNMIKSSFTEEYVDSKINFKTMIPLAIATSIDALAVGVTFAFLNVNIIKAVILIGVTTFIMSFLGVYIGNKFENKLGPHTQLIGGIILILIGTKILLEHLKII